MKSLFWASFGLLVSLVGLALAVFVDNMAWALIQGALVGLNLVGVSSHLRSLLRDLRLRELMRHRRRLAIRGFAYAQVWGDRADPSNPRHALYRHAMLGTYRALDELVSARVAMTASQSTL